MEEKQVRKATLGDLKRTVVNVEITLADGEVVSIPMRTLTYFQYNAIRWSVPDPKPPVSGVDKSGRPVFDVNDGTFRRQVAEAEMLRTHKLLLAALEMDVPGETEEARLDYLQTEVDAAVVRQLISVMQMTSTGGEARIAARAESFRSGQPADANDAGTRTVAADTDGVG